LSKGVTTTSGGLLNTGTVLMIMMTNGEAGEMTTNARRTGGEGGPGVLENVLDNHQHDPSPHQSTPDDEEMVDAERDLAEDAQWKKIQQNTL